MKNYIIFLLFLIVLNLLAVSGIIPFTKDSLSSFILIVSCFQILVLGVIVFIYKDKLKTIIILQDKIIAFETDDKEIYSDLDKAQKELESFKNQDDSEFKKSNVPGVCENYKEYFESITEIHHGPAK